MYSSIRALTHEHTELTVRDSDPPFTHRPARTVARACVSACNRDFIESRRVT